MVPYRTSRQHHRTLPGYPASPLLTWPFPQPPGASHGPERRRA